MEIRKADASCRVDFLGRCIIGFLLSTRGWWYIFQGCRDWCWFGGRNGWEQIGWREAWFGRKCWPVATWNVSKLVIFVEMRRALLSKKIYTVIYVLQSAFSLMYLFFHQKTLNESYTINTLQLSLVAVNQLLLTYQRQRFSPGESMSCNNVWLRWNRYVWSVGRKVWTKRRCLGRCFGRVVIVVIVFLWKRKENSARVIIWYGRNF